VRDFAGRGVDRDPAQLRMLNLKVMRGATTDHASWPE
jgi:hypothetical protein